MASIRRILHTQSVFVVCGLPKAGKSIVGESLVRKIQLKSGIRPALFRTDQFRNPEDADLDIDRRRAAGYGRLTDAVSAHLSEDDHAPLIVEGVFDKPQYRAAIEKAAARHGVDVKYVKVNTPHPIRMSRQKKAEDAPAEKRPKSYDSSVDSGILEDTHQSGYYRPFSLPRRQQYATIDNAGNLRQTLPQLDTLAQQIVDEHTLEPLNEKQLDEKIREAKKERNPGRAVYNIVKDLYHSCQWDAMSYLNLTRNPEFERDLDHYRLVEVFGRNYHTRRRADLVERLKSRVFPLYGERMTATAMRGEFVQPDGKPNRHPQTGRPTAVLLQRYHQTPHDPQVGQVIGTKQNPAVLRSAMFVPALHPSQELLDDAPLIHLPRQLPMMGITAYARRRVPSDVMAYTQRLLNHPELEDVLERRLLRAEMEHMANKRQKELIAAIEEKDSYTRRHTDRVREGALQLGRAMAVHFGFTDYDFSQLEEGAQLHDSGKILIRDDVLNKQDQLSRHEFEEMRAHAILGGVVAKHYPGFHPIAHTITDHHSWHDGNARAYPWHPFYRGADGKEHRLFAQLNKDELIDVTEKKDPSAVLRKIHAAKIQPEGHPDGRFLSAQEKQALEEGRANVIIRPLQGDEIHPFARLVSVMDVFDALVTKRKYAKPIPGADVDEGDSVRRKMTTQFSVERALEFIRHESGTHFDPAVANRFVKLVKTDLNRVKRGLKPTGILQIYRKHYPQRIVMTKKDEVITEKIVAKDVAQQLNR